METVNGWGSWGLDGSYPIVLVGVSMACLSLGATLMYVVHSRRFRLNWFERSRLDSLACEEATVVKLCNRQRYHSGSTCSGGSLADLTAALPPLATTSDASRSSSLQKLQSRASYSGAGQGEPTGCSTVGASSKGGVCPDAQSLRSVASSASVATTGTVHSILDPLPTGISAASSELNVGSDHSPCSDVSSVIQKYVQPAAPGSSTASQRPKVNTMYEKIDHTKFNATMYRAEDAASMGGGEESEEAPRVHFSLTYNAHFSVLCVRVINASGLSPSALAGGIANPYIRVRLLPESKSSSNRSKIGQVQRNTLEPQFEEDFIFNGITITDLSTKVLEVLVLNCASEDADHTSCVSTGSFMAGEECLGGVHWSLDQMVDPMREHNIKPVTLDLPLCSAGELRRNTPSHGELQLSMSYLQSAERLTVSVLKARSLPTVGPEHKKAGDAPDAFVKLTLTTTAAKSGKATKKKKKTNTQKNTTCPIFSEAFTFSMSKDTLRSASLQLVVAHETPPSLPLQQKELALAKLIIPAGTLAEFVHSAGNGVQAKWFRLASPTP